MRRTTISRSELTVLAALLAGVSATAQAQQPPAVQRPIQQAQQAADQQPATPRRVEISSGSVSQGEVPATHTVVQGETLWSIAGQYLGDPMLWPEIYRLNTNVVEDPHWIYPGEELRLTPDSSQVTAAPSDSTVVVQQGLTVTPTDSTQPAQGPVSSPTAGPTIFSTSAAVGRRANTYQVATQRAYRAVREGEYFSSGFLTEGQPLDGGRIVASSRTRSGNEFARASAQNWETVILEAPPGETLQPGDLLLSYRMGEDLGTWGRIVRPTGMLRVKSLTGERWSAEIIRVYDQVEQFQGLLKVQPFVSNSNRRAEPVVGGIEGSVIAIRDGNQVPQMQDVLFIDKGANDGVRLGDVFQIYRPRQDSDRGTTVEQDLARAIVVNTRSATATVIIVELYGSEVRSRSLVRQVRRMPS
jgi:LysM repeat protein